MLLKLEYSFENNYKIFLIPFQFVDIKETVKFPKVRQLTNDLDLVTQILRGNLNNLVSFILCTCLGREP